MRTVNSITSSISQRAEIKDNILFAASPIDQTNGNCWTTSEIETQPKNSPWGHWGPLPNATLLPLEHVVNYRSVCAQHVVWVENTHYFLGPQFLRSQLQRWWSTIVNGGDLDIMFLLSLLLNRNPALISPNSAIACVVELLLHGQKGARNCMPQISGMGWFLSPILSPVILWVVWLLSKWH